MLILHISKGVSGIENFMLFWIANLVFLLFSDADWRQDGAQNITVCADILFCCFF